MIDSSEPQHHQPHEAGFAGAAGYAELEVEAPDIKHDSQNEVTGLLAELIAEDGEDHTRALATMRRSWKHRREISEAALNQFESGSLDPMSTAQILYEFGASEHAAGAVELIGERLDGSLAMALERIATPETAPVLAQKFESITAGQTFRQLGFTSWSYLRIAIAGMQRYPEQAEAWGPLYEQACQAQLADAIEDFADDPDFDPHLWLQGRIDNLSEDLAPNLVTARHIDHFFGRQRDPDFASSRSLRHDQRGYQDQSPILPAPDRMQVITNLHALAEYPPTGAAADTQNWVVERMTYLEVNAPAHAATIGIEVEVDKSLLTDTSALGQLTPDQQLDLAYRRRLDQFRSEQAGVPADDDAGWEFAHLPARYYGVLTAEVQALMDLQLVNPAVTPHPLHVTVGGISTDGPGGGEPAVLLRALEATGWTSSGDRLHQPLKGGKDLTPDGTWAYQSPNGLSERPPNEILGDTEVAVELRTLEFKDMIGLDRTLRTAYSLGSAIGAFQRSEAGASLTEQEQQLTSVWRETSTEIQALLSEYGMEQPPDTWVATQQTYDPNIGQVAGQLNDSFLTMAHLLQEAEQITGRGTHFQSAMRIILVSARSEAMKFLKPNPDNVG